MSASVLIIAAVFLGVVTLILFVAMALRDKSVLDVEGRLNSLTSKADLSSLSELSHQVAKDMDAKSALEQLVARWMNLSLMFEQAKVTLTVAQFVAICAGLGVGGTFLCSIAGVSLTIAPVVGLAFTGLPFLWLSFRRKRRLSKFAGQLSGALELVARALRAGHSLAAGFHLVSQEGSEPIAEEFGRVFEEQNLGIPFEEALDNLTKRIPNLDLKFFVTAVILQRQTGGDLAEILDKISHLIRERYKILGQVQALTGEGRLSGIVLLALPPLLFITVYRMNHDYINLLFTDDLGHKMLIYGVVSQLVGALVIRKIINIRV